MQGSERQPPCAGSFPIAAICRPRGWPRGMAGWKAAVVPMRSEKGRNFCWGGGTAIRRSIFEQSGVLHVWRSSVSDDYSLTRALERNNRPIVFIPECLTPSYVETDFPGLLEFTNRQILITRVYADRVG